MNFTKLVNRIRKEMNLDNKVPGFDPKNGNERAKYLFLLEAPGPRAVETGQISFDNPDPTARNLRCQLKAAGIAREEIALWNTVPWFIGKVKNKGNKRRGKKRGNEKLLIRSVKGGDVERGTKYLKPLVAAMPKLRCIVLVGGAARRAHIYLSSVTAARIVSCHHTSARGQKDPRAKRENIAVFRFIKKSS